MGKLEQQLTELLSDPVSAVGFELLGIEVMLCGRGSSVVRVFIDHTNGITVDDCARVSEQISAVLDVEDPIQTEYNLEVSSPGIDRRLFTAEQFSRFIGEQALVHLKTPLGKQKKIQGEIVEVVQDNIHLSVGSENIAITFADIHKANLVPNFA